MAHEWHTERGEKMKARTYDAREEYRLAWAGIEGFTTDKHRRGT